MKKCVGLFFAALFALLLFAFPAFAVEGASLFDSPEVNRLLDQNYAQVKEQGWAELRIPKSLHGIGEERFSASSIAAAKTLIAAGHEAYIVGGAVRDFVMGKEANDFDIVTDASHDEVAALLPGVTFHTIQNGLKFGVAHYEGENVDVATFVNIPKEYKGVPGVPDFNTDSLYGENALVDSFQRDFTMNAIYYDVKTGDLVDFHGGLRDIRDKRIATMVSPSLEFGCKPNTLFRGLRFQSRYGFHMDAAAEKDIKKEYREVRGNHEGLDPFQ